jgi:hypothetical protein
MEQTTPPDAPAMPVWLVKAFAVITSVNVLVAILSHWKGYDASAKFMAVVLVAWLIIMPVIATWRWKRTIRFEWSDLWITYVVLMLATLLFSR